jgi:hypothetical protein
VFGKDKYQLKQTTLGDFFKKKSKEQSSAKISVVEEPSSGLEPSS